MQIVLYLVLLKNSLGWGKLNLRSNILKKRLLRIFVDLDYNRCYEAPAQACSLAPSKLQTGVRPKSKQDSQCESCLLCSLTPARLIRIKRITSDEA